MSALAMTTPAEEERAARAQHRHLEKMRREAERARLARVKAARRERARELRTRRDELARDARHLERAYGRALAAAMRDPDRPCPDERDREMDRAYARLVTATTRLANHDALIAREVR